MGSTDRSGQFQCVYSFEKVHYLGPRLLHEKKNSFYINIYKIDMYEQSKEKNVYTIFLEDSRFV